MVVLGLTIPEAPLNSITMTPVGTVHSTRKTLTDDNWLREHASIELDAAQFSDDALAGLTDFSHVEIVFFMDKADPPKSKPARATPTTTPPGPASASSPSAARTAPIISASPSAELKKVSGTTLVVEGLDAIDGTPVLDIKPWVAEFGPRGATHEPTWVTELNARLLGILRRVNEQRCHPERRVRAVLAARWRKNEGSLRDVWLRPFLRPPSL